MENPSNSIGLKYELKRKLIHISSLVIPLSYYFLDRNFLLIILFIFSVLSVLIDIIRRSSPGFGKLYDKIFGDILREHETDKKNIFFTGGTYILISFFLCVLLFQKDIAILSMMVIIVCDTAAAITGKTIGRRKIGSKTLEGSIAFFITALILYFLILKQQGLNVIYAGLLTVFLTTLFELIPLKADDNITIPLFFGIVYSTLTNTKLLI